MPYWRTFPKALTIFADTFEEAHSILHAGTIRANTETVLKNLSIASSVMERDFPATLASVREAMQRVAMAADQLSAASASAQSTLGRDSSAMADFRRLLKESSEAVRALRALAEMLERNPESLIKGKQGIR